MTPVNLAEKFTKIPDPWNPRIAGELDGRFVELLKRQRASGEFLRSRGAVRDGEGTAWRRSWA